MKPQPANINRASVAFVWRSLRNMRRQLKHKHQHADFVEEAGQHRIFIEGCWLQEEKFKVASTAEWWNVGLRRCVKCVLMINEILTWFLHASFHSTAIYEDESDNDLSMESHGSVVTHLLSQVKIGMDLTKVVLPTFILERRSLLEMYADYFAHPDLFIRIADFKDPRDRMVQVVRWYLSAYHAGRKSSVAKKPYNPIIGEVFRCHWNIPEFGKLLSQCSWEEFYW